MTTLPRLIDCRGIMAQVGVKEATALRLMRMCPSGPIRVGRKSFVIEAEVVQVIEDLKAAA